MNDFLIYSAFGFAGLFLGFAFAALLLRLVIVNALKPLIERLDILESFIDHYAGKRTISLPDRSKNRTMWG